MRANDELCLGAPGHIGLKEPVRIVEVGEDNRKVREVIPKFHGQLSIASEEPGQRASFNRAHFLRQPPGNRKLCDVTVAQDLDARPGQPGSQHRQYGQGENEVPNGATADNEDLSRRLTHS